MRIDDYEYEEEKTLSSLAELLSGIAQQVADRGDLELPMPSFKSGIIELPLSEPIETGIEVSLRKQSVRVRIDLNWSVAERERLEEVEGDKE
ncbi:MAG: hypothetical protein KGY80_09950 [Candidatus Thorarchaeota archaeon]|jgi:hypothetical protein|nr:hypothetical protein [Candidatus Thorarchaeota archaeon]